ncbi:M23 family metallopeptidase [Mucilaginibacter sp. X5P1]|uniref:M23 family metallopeptidase n=1 Tax=Mucilaginibacter sp. X5P1 TaxID=2723088 RepID=UPI001612C42A|nr:M23 family metallopeptidase [Mucilaginibacter sp. X5P1]MBB6137657.1 murein DD-endopeptidase MepM/ murein hydrolase activator NlpD [Mucilaginibacter sp. X5P1]
MIRFLALTVLLRASPVYAQVGLPLRHLFITSGFGNRVHPVTGSYGFHYGIDLRARSDTVLAVLDGRVENAGYNLFLGIFIRISSGPFTITYGHLSQCFVCIGDSLATGSPMGVTGSSGRVTGEHLHFAVQFFHRYIDPLTFLTAAEKISNH